MLCFVATGRLAGTVAQTGNMYYRYFITHTARTKAKMPQLLDINNKNRSVMLEKDFKNAVIESLREQVNSLQVKEICDIRYLRI